VRRIEHHAADATRGEEHFRRHAASMAPASDKLALAVVEMGESDADVGKKPLSKFGRSLSRMRTGSLRKLVKEQEAETQRYHRWALLACAGVVVLAVCTGAAVAVAGYLLARPKDVIYVSDADNGTLVFSHSQLANRSDWGFKQYASGWESHKLTFAIQPANETALDERLSMVSLPGSPHYGRHLSYDEAHSLAANWHGTRTVLRWLRHVVGAEVLRIHSHGRYIDAQANTSVWERALETRLAHLAHESGLSQVIRAVEDVRLPDDVASHLSGVLRLTQIPVESAIVVISYPALGAEAADAFSYGGGGSASSSYDGNDGPYTPTPSPVSTSCASATSCTSCVLAPPFDCGWCGGGCHDGSSSGPTQSGACGANGNWAWGPSDCPDGEKGPASAPSMPSCSEQKTCSSCTSGPPYNCGWCDGACVEGTSGGSSGGTCSANDGSWAWVSASCAAASSGSGGGSSTSSTCSQSQEPPMSKGSGKITPQKLRSFYNVGSAQGSDQVSQGVFESAGQSYSPADLSQFQSHFGLPPQPVASDVGGHSVSQGYCAGNGNSCGEANLDVQYIMGVAPGVPTTFWDVDSNGESNAAFGLDLEQWVDKVANDRNPPLVNSISYGAPETSFESATLTAFNNEARLLGLQGVTILVSSGDDGVSGPESRPGLQQSAPCAYRPNFPASSPYVTTLGATQGVESGLPETVCSAHTGGGITSGGGFSSVFAKPAWQTSAVNGYLSRVATAPAPGFNTTGRGYPDLALAGHSYEVVIGGKFTQVDGTSCSSPAFAGMISLINAKRKTEGKAPLGFLNHMLYATATATAFNDITTGNNRCTASGQSLFGILPPTCCCEGFDATDGWDPVSGLGSIDFQKLAQVIG